MTLTGLWIIWWVIRTCALPIQTKSGNQILRQWIMESDRLWSFNIQEWKKWWLFLKYNQWGVWNRPNQSIPSTVFYFFNFFFLGGESLFHKDNLNILNISFPFQLSGFFHFLNCTYQVSVLFLNNDLASVEYMNVIIVLNFSSWL